MPLDNKQEKSVFYYKLLCTKNEGMGTLGEDEVNPGYIFKKK